MSIKIQRDGKRETKDSKRYGLLLDISKEQEYSGVKIIGCNYLNEKTLQ
jgi:hypothetical protein